MKIKENEKGEKYSDLAREQKQTEEYESNDDISCKWWAWKYPQKLGKWAGKYWKWKTNEDHPNYKTTRISWKVLENGGDLLSLRFLKKIIS